MIRSIALNLTFLGLVIGLRAQDIRWASDIVDFSSEYAMSEFSTKQALGEPNAMGPGSKLSNGWRPKDGDKNPFIMVRFSDPIEINQFVIAESQGAGQIKKILLYDADFLEYDAYEAESSSGETSSGYFHQFITQTGYPVHAMRVSFFNPEKRPIGIDAIGVANNSLPVTSLLKEKINEIFNEYRITKLNESINSPFNEHNPILSLDGTKLYFSRQNDPNNVGGAKDIEDIWFSVWNENAQDWNDPINIGPPLNNKGPNFLSSIGTLDGEEVYILGNRYGKKERMLTGVSLAYLADGVFSDPIALEIDKYYNYSKNVDFFLVENPAALIVSAEMDDSRGNRDLYITFRNPDRLSWAAPVNLGDAINSFGAEESPFLDRDGKTLYFSSDGFRGYGGLDIFRTTRLDDTWTNWSTPVNLGPRINSEGDDEYLSISPSEKHLYFTRSGKDGNSDIYNVNLDPPTVLLSGTVLDSLSGEPIKGADVFISNTEGKFEFTRTNDQGYFKKTLTSKTDWTVTAAKNDFALVSPIGAALNDQDLKLTEPVLLKPIMYLETRNKLSLDSIVTTAVEIRDDRERGVASPTLTSQLDAMEEGESLQLHNVYFDLNSSYLRAESYPELMELASFLIEHIDLKVELSAHTDSRQSKKYNKWMSDRRAKRVADYLISFGIKPNRITSKGYGEEKLVNECADEVECSEEKHQENRRTEIKLLKDQVTQ